VTEQIVRPAELILVDDASTDHTRSIIDRIKRSHGSDWLRTIFLENNHGPATARNAAWNAATQPYIAFLDADDAWHAQKIDAQLQFMQSHTDVVLSAHAYRLCEAGEKVDIDHIRRSAQLVTCRSLLLSNRLATRTVMLKRDLPYRFKEGKRYAEDYLLWLQIACDGHKIALLDMELAYVYKGAFGVSGLSESLWKMEKGELETYKHLYQKEHIRLFALVVLMAWSLLRYFRRVLFQFLQNK
jgi:glycosyltransferase involved in cell wall biosynthesis